MFLPKKMPNRSICRQQFADDNLPTTICRHTICQKNIVFNILYYQQLNHDLPYYDLPKCCFNKANVVLTTCNNRQYWSKQTSEGLQVVASTEGLSLPRGRASFRVGKLWLFCAICRIVWFWQIVSRKLSSANCRWQIVVGKLCVGKSWVGKSNFGKSLPTL